MFVNGADTGGRISPSFLAVTSAPNSNAIIHPSLNSIMIGHTFLTLLLPLLIALFYFSTPQTRRKPIFVLNVIAIILAFTAGVMIDGLAIHSILSPQTPWSLSVNIAIGIIGASQSILVDLILLVRLVSVHPLSHLGLGRFALLTSLPILLKIARVVNLIMFIKVLADAGRGPLGPEKIAIVWVTTPYLKIEWSAQMVDNTYASLSFLWAIRGAGNGQGVTSDVHPNRVTFAQRMRTLSRIALSNFIIPSLFSIAQLVVVYRNVNVLIVNEIVLVNTMLAVFGVVFATVWAGNVRRREAQADGWENTSRIDEDACKKRPVRGFAIPGLGSWRVASSPPGLSLGSTGYAAPAENAGLKVGPDAIVSEKGDDQGADSLQVEVQKREVVESSGFSTPSSN